MFLSVAFEICLNNMLTTDVLNTFTQTLCVRCDNVFLGFVHEEFSFCLVSNINK